MSKEFYVHTDLLKDVAKDIRNLLDKITAEDASKGTFAQFQKARSIDGPTATFWDGPNALAEAYSSEYDYVCKTFTQLITQLTNVMTACTTTADKYATHEGNAKHDVTSSAPTLAP